MVNNWALGKYLRAITLCAVFGSLHAAPARDVDCTQRAAAHCLRTLALPQAAGQLRYFASHQPVTPDAPSAPVAPTAALIVIHGYSRDANGSFNAALKAAQQAGKSSQTVVIAPIFQVDAANALRCSSRKTPAAQPGDATWNCSSWAAGNVAGDSAAPISSFAAVDALLAETKRQWPTLRSITLVGFSAGAQLLQRYTVFAAPAPEGVVLRYVVAAPGSWLYFDERRPQPLRSNSNDRPDANNENSSTQKRVELANSWAPCDTLNACDFAFRKPAQQMACPRYNDWRYGLDAMPSQLATAASPTTVAAMRERYRAAPITYAIGANDQGTSQEARYQVLDKSCAAKLQGPFRLQRALAFYAYDKAVIQPQHPRAFIMVPGCAHSATCVLPSAEMRAVLFP